MAISPGIPTSFVPKQPVQPVARRPMSSGRNVFLLASLGLAGLSLLLAGATFAFDKYLQSSLNHKQALLADAQNKVDKDTIESFVRLRDRLSSGKDLLANHVELSQFFTELESVTLQNVRFSDMKLTVAGDHTAKIQMNGTAKNFNALAAQSNAFAGDPRIKRAIFSGINLTSTKLVSFTLTADIDPKLILESGQPSVPAVQGITREQAIASSTPASSTPAAPVATSSASTSTVKTTP